MKISWTTPSLHLTPRTDAPPNNTQPDPKRAKKSRLYNRIKIVMPCYLVIDGVKKEMEEDIFDQMVEALYQPNTPNNTPQNSQSRWDVVEPLPTTLKGRWKPDGTYDKKPLDEDYFKKYYHKNLKVPFKRPDCGRTISSKSNLSKHRQTSVCMRKRNSC